MSKTRKPTDYATRQDVEEIVSSVVNEALRAVGLHFNQLEHKVDNLGTEISELRISNNRIERKLDNTIGRTDTHSRLLDHNLKIGALKHIPA